MKACECGVAQWRAGGVARAGARERAGDPTQAARLHSPYSLFSTYSLPGEGGEGGEGGERDGARGGVSRRDGKRTERAPRQPPCTTPIAQSNANARNWMSSALPNGLVTRRQRRSAAQHGARERGTAANNTVPKPHRSRCARACSSCCGPPDLPWP